MFEVKTLKGIPDEPKVYLITFPCLHTARSEGYRHDGFYPERPFRLNPLLLVPLVLNRVAEPGRPFVAFTRRFDLLLDLRLISTPDDIDPSIPLEPSSPSYYIDSYFRINTWLTQTFMETRTVNNIYSQKYEKN